MTTSLLNALVPIFAVMALGYFAGRAREVDSLHGASLNTLVMDFALPGAMFIASAASPTLALLLLPQLG